MKKTILAISDTHGKVKEMENILETVQYDASIHLGDFENKHQFVKENFNFHVPGNGDDYYCKDDQFVIFEVYNVRILLLHGHQFSGFLYNIEKFYKSVSNYAKEQKVNLVIHGHFHKASTSLVNQDGILILSPGSLNFPRDGAKGSYMLVDIEEGKVSNFNIIRI